MTDREKKISGVVSLHDVMPSTLHQCRRLVEMLQALDVTPVTLLVVPGHQWSDRDLKTLSDWQAQGLILAGHGWHHEARHISRPYHRLHSMILSRRAAEHLSLEGEEILGLIRNCYEWFLVHELTPPNLYVPPAWALGRVQKQRLQELPFDYYELLAGVLNARDGKETYLPLVGYQADTSLRALSLKPWNSFNEWLAAYTGLPLRIGLHPGDDDLKLAQQMRQQIRGCDHFLGYSEIFLGDSPESVQADEPEPDRPVAPAPDQEAAAEIRE